MITFNKRDNSSGCDKFYLHACLFSSSLSFCTTETELLSLSTDTSWHLNKHVKAVGWLFVVPATYANIKR